MKEDRGQRTDNRSNAALLITVCAIAFVAFVLRIYRLDYFSLRGDESFTVIFVQRTWEGLWKGISTVEPNPPLMYLALRAWIAVAGASEFATRYFSLFFGVLCVPLIYRLAKEMFAGSVIASDPHSGERSNPQPWWRLLRRFAARNDIVALIAAAIIAVNPYQIWHSQDVRNYTMWPALSLLGLIFFWRWWKREATDDRQQTTDLRFTFYGSRLASLSFFVLATLASLYTHYYDVFILAALNVFVFGFALWERRWKMLGRWVGAQIALVVLYAPWVLFGTNRITSYGEASAEQSISMIDVFSRTISAFVLSETVPDTIRSIVWLPLAIIVVAILILLARRNRERAAFLLLYIVIPTLALYVLSIGRPLFLERYLNGIAPAYYLVLAIGLAALWQWQSRWRVVAIGIPSLLLVASSVFAFWNFQFDPAYAKAPDWRGLTQQITAQPGDIVVQNFTEMSPLYYLGTTIPLTTLPKDYWYTPTDEKRLQQLNNDYRRIWFIPAAPDQWDSDHLVEKFLAHTDERVSIARAGTLSVQLYLTPHESQSKMVPVNTRVGDAILIGYRVEGARTLHVVLYWQATRKIAKDYTVFVHLADANGNVMAQQDHAPAFGLYPTTAWQPGESIVDVYDVPVDAPAGIYSLIVGMYDPNTLIRLPVTDSNGNRLSDDQIVLTQITIAP